MSGGRRRCGGQDRGRGRSGGWSGRVEECRRGIGDGVFWSVSKLFTLLCQISLFRDSSDRVRSPAQLRIHFTNCSLFFFFFVFSKWIKPSGVRGSLVKSCIPRHLTMVPLPTVGWSVTRSGWRGRGVAVTRRVSGMCGRAEQHGKSVESRESVYREEVEGKVRKGERQE